MKKDHLIEIIETIAPLHFQADWDASGMQVASESEKVTHVAVMLDPSEASVKKALDAGADFLLAHHPLGMKPQPLGTLNAHFAVVAAIIRQSACLYSAHTSLDANPKGPVRWLAHALSLKDVRILEPVSEEHGFGFIGDLPQPMSYAEFCRLLGDLGIERWRSCGPLPQSITRVACCPGSGSGLAHDACAGGADIFITGDMKYHPATEAPLRILDVGHFILEEKMMQVVAHNLGQALAIPVTFIAAADPFLFEEASAEYL